MYLQKVISKKTRKNLKNIFCWLLEGQRRKEYLDLKLDPDTLVIGTDPRIRIRTKNLEPRS
jgi:hypothetical protein